MKFLDFFSGIGTIRIGMEQAGHECVGHVEWDKYAQASYMAMHDVKESEFIGWDIRGVRANELPRADAWWFGAPCQDFSIAGKRKGLEGDRSSLVREIFRLVRETEETDRPEWLLYENVKGMLSSNGGFDFLGILLEMDELGYDIEWHTLNSKNFGVPQNRERVFTIGHSRRFGRREIFPIRNGISEIDEIEVQERPGTNLIPIFTVAMPEVTRRDIASRFSFRDLTPRECFRLQGVPDEYFDKAKAVNSESQLYKQAGNACTVNVIYEIAKRLEVNNGTL